MQAPEHGNLDKAEIEKNAVNVQRKKIFIYKNIHISSNNGQNGTKFAA